MTSKQYKTCHKPITLQKFSWTKHTDLLPSIIHRNHKQYDKGIASLKFTFIERISVTCRYPAAYHFLWSIGWHIRTVDRDGRELFLTGMVDTRRDNIPGMWAECWLKNIDYYVFEVRSSNYKANNPLNKSYRKKRNELLNQHQVCFEIFKCYIIWFIGCLITC